MLIVFYVAALIAVIATVRVIVNTSPIYALLNLIISLIAISAVFFSLGAYFAAALEIIVYAGAIMVLFVFVVMMLNLGHQVAEQEKAWLAPKTWLGPSIMAVILLVVMIFGVYSTSGKEIPSTVIDAKAVGISLFGPYVLMVELASMLLLAGLVVAYHLGRSNQDAEDEVVDELKRTQGGQE